MSDDIPSSKQSSPTKTKFRARLLTTHRAIPAVLEKSAKGERGKYAPLDQVLPIIRTACLDNDLLLTVSADDSVEMVGVVIRVLDAHSDESISAATHCPRDEQAIKPAQGKMRGSMNVFQAHGSGHTYLLRRAVADLFGVCTGTEIDPDAAHYSPRQDLAPATLEEVEAVLETTTPETWPKDKERVRSLLTRMPKGDDRQRAIAMSSRTNELMQEPST